MSSKKLILRFQPKLKMLLKLCSWKRLNRRKNFRNFFTKQKRMIISRDTWSWLGNWDIRKIFRAVHNGTRLEKLLISVTFVIRKFIRFFCGHQNLERLKPIILGLRRNRSNRSLILFWKTGKLILSGRTRGKLIRS